MKNKTNIFTRARAWLQADLTALKALIIVAVAALLIGVLAMVDTWLGGDGSIGVGIGFILWLGFVFLAFKGAFK